MSKSTPICELNNSINNQDNTTPIVQDILKEIQLENENQADYINEQDRSLNYQLDDNIIADHDNDNENQTQSKNEIENDYDENQHDQKEIEQFESDINIHDDDITQNLGEIPYIESQKEPSEVEPDNIIHKYFNQFKEPILVFLVVMILGIPSVSKVINNIQKTIPGLNNQIGHLLIGGLLGTGVFYALNNYI